MNRQIRRLGLGILACYVALFAMINWVQVLQADDYNANPLNTASARRDFNKPRGTIETADGALLAVSVPNPDQASQFERLRQYPEGDLFAQLTGYLSYWFGTAGLEESYNAELAGQTFEQQVRGLTDLFVDNASVGNLTLSVRKDLQQVARDALGDQEGSVVAMDVQTGELLAFWSFPSYDPNLLAGTDYRAVDGAWRALDADPADPMLPHQYREIYFPGSTFKVVTAGIGLQSGQVTATQPDYPVVRGYTPPLTDLEISNFGGTPCGGTLFEILARSCNSSFAQMGVDLGAGLMVPGAESFGFNAAPPIDLPLPATSRFPTDYAGKTPLLAQAAIGQYDVRATPLQMAMVAGAVANQGRMMVPNVVHEVRDSDQEVVSRHEPEVWRTPLSPEHAETLRQAMLGVVSDGTAGNLAIPGYEVGGKTGTAQLGTDPPTSHTWIIGFGGPPGQPAQVAVSVVVLDQPGASEFTGGQVAAPIARAVLQAALEVHGGG